MNKLSIQSSNSFKKLLLPKRGTANVVCVVLCKEHYTAALGTGTMAYLYCVSWMGWGRRLRHFWESEEELSKAFRDGFS